MSNRKWIGVENLMRRYERRWSLTRWLPINQNDDSAVVAAFVFLRPIILTMLVYPAYAFQAPVRWMIIGIAGVTFVDSLVVVTVHAFLDERPPASLFRYVVLNFVTYGTLTSWFAIFFAPLASHFSPALTPSRGITVAFVAITSTNVAWPIQPISKLAYLVSGLATLMAFYFVIVILARAIGRNGSSH